MREGSQGRAHDPSRLGGAIDRPRWPGGRPRIYTELEARRLDLYFDDTGEPITELNAPLLERNGEELGRKLGIAEWDSEAMQVFLQRVINPQQVS